MNVEGGWRGTFREKKFMDGKKRAGSSGSAHHRIERRPTKKEVCHSCDRRAGRNNEAKKPGPQKAALVRRQTLDTARKGREKERSEKKNFPKRFKKGSGPLTGGGGGERTS